MIPVDEALAACLALTEPLPVEDVALSQAAGRVLARPITARRDQPPFAASAMDGYAVAASAPHPGDRFSVIGEAAAGHGWDGVLAQGAAVRIFTGAPVPEGTARVIIQEDVTRDGDTIALGDRLDGKTNIRPAGGDFTCGDRLAAPRRLRPADIALAAAMNHATLPVTREPVVALIATGDELVQPGDAPRADQIVASNAYGLKAMAEAAGAHARLLPIARDTVDSLASTLALAADADLIVTIGGASVGDHDLVARVAAAEGLERSFYKVAIRPGKPLMAGRMGRAALLGLPGNPVSAMVCGQVFLVPMIRAMLGLGKAPAPREKAQLAIDLPANGPRDHYMRATLSEGGALPRVTPDPRQDSSLLSVLARAEALLIHPANAGPLAAGAPVEILRL
ncbi:molybdopterin molybdenumtransferase MoeA [Rhodobacteraceae bacterium W635]|uniref:molybdopterin molybdotransferase MoeA n=1 Tax=Nioella halotolerans TaxID=2303578 RepID=UPI000E3D0374|nr:molybdopterin molybdenumtransferase MoeA [Rhodobacteraceae bacterium W635]